MSAQASRPAPVLALVPQTPHAPLDELLDRFKRYLRLERGLSPNTLASYAHDLTVLARWLERNHVEPLALTEEHARLYLDEHARAGLSPSTLGRRVASLRAFYRFLRLEELVSSDPTAKLRPPAKPRSLPRSLRQVDVARLLEAPQGSTPRALRDRAVLELLYGAGLRISEATQLDVADLDLSRGELNIRHAKGGKQRLVPVGRGVTAAAHAYLEHGRPRIARAGELALFVGRCGRFTRQGLYKIVMEHARAAGLADRLSPHTLRHTYASHLLAGGADIRTVQELLGHADLDTTQVYTHLVIDDLKAEYARAHPLAQQEGSR